MSEVSSGAPSSAPVPDLRSLDQLFDRGRYLQVYRALRGPDEQRRPQGKAELALLARTCANMECFSQAVAWHRVLQRQHPGDPETRVQHLQLLGLRHRLLESVQLAQEHPALEGADERQQLRWQTARCTAFGRVRDFAQAERVLSEARQRFPGHPWLDEAQAWLRFQQDRLDEAVQLVQGVCDAHPDDYSSHHLRAAFLHEQDRVEEAVAAIEQILPRFETPALARDLFDWSVERGRVEEGLAVLAPALERYPRPPRALWRGLCARIVRAYYLIGDLPRAAQYAGELGPEQDWLARAVTDPGPGARVQLEVPYVRQDHLSCGPASLASQLKYFGEEVSMREVADEITYDGTADHRQRDWCRRHGMIVRHFQFQPESARELIDAGLPFALVTHAPSSSHMQVVVGYDTVLGTWLFREPGIHGLVEAHESTLMERIEARGSMAVLVLPARQAARNPAHPLPQEAECEALVQLRYDLEQHRRDEAARSLALVLRGAQGPLRWDAERAEAWSRQDLEALLRISRVQCEAAPEDPLCREHLLRDLIRSGRWREAQDLLEDLESRDACPPVLLPHLVGLLGRRATQLPRARRLARRACLRTPTMGRAYEVLARVLWVEPARRSEALLAHRLASCLEPMDEALALADFDARRKLGQLEEGLAHLRERAERSRGKSPRPAVTYAQALRRSWRVDESLEVLARARQDHEDPWARAVYVEQLTEAGRHDEALAVLDAEALRFRPLDLILLRLQVLRSLGRSEEAAALIEVAAREHPAEVELQQLWLETVEERAGLLAAAERSVELGRQHEGSAWVRLACRQHARAGDLDAVERLLREGLQRDPDDAGLRSELAGHLLDTQRAAESAQEAEELVRRHGHAAIGWADLGRARAALGRRLAAWESFRRSLELDINHGRVMHSMLQQAADREQAREGLDFLVAQLRLQGPQSGGLDAFCELARGSLPEDELESTLRGLRQDFAGEPEPGEALVEVALAHQDVERARRRAEDGVRRFPWRASAHLLLARVHQARRDRKAERDTLRRLVSRLPDCSAAWARLGESFEEEGRLSQAEEAYRRGLQHTPRDGVLYGYLAEVQYRRGDLEGGVQTLRQALRLFPDYGWAMRCEVLWLNELGRPQEAFERAEHHTRVQAEVSAAHEARAEAARALGRYEDSLESLRRALDCDPRLGETRGVLVAALGEMGQFDQARAVIEEGRQLLGQDELMLQEAILWRREGRLEEARDHLRDALQRKPEDLQAWSVLLRWLDTDGCHDQILALQERPPASLREIPGFWGFVADAHQARGNGTAALDCLEQALALDPHDERVLLRLGKIRVQRREWQDLERLLPRSTDPDGVSDEAACLLAFLARWRGEPDGFARCLLRVFRAPEVLSPQFELLALRVPGLREFSMRELAEAMEEVAVGDATQAGPALTALCAARSQRGRFVKRLDALPRTSDPQRAALEKVLRIARGTRCAEAAAEWVVQRLRPPLRPPNLLAQVSSLLADDHPAELARFFDGDWRNQEIPAWALANYAIALRHLGRDEDMVEVCRFALELPRSPAMWFHRVMLAWDAYRQEEYDACLELCEVSEPGVATPNFEASLLRLLVELRRREASPAELRATLKAALASADSVREEGGHPLSDRFFRMLRAELRRLCPGPAVFGFLLRARLRRLRWWWRPRKPAVVVG